MDTKVTYHVSFSLSNTYHSLMPRKQILAEDEIEGRVPDSIH